MPRSEYLKQYYQDHKSQFRAYGKKAKDKLREGVILAYGGKCACCGEREILFLGIDHIHGNGTIERRTKQWQILYAELRRNPVDLTKYRVLCRNCNFAVWANDGVCPHMSLITETEESEWT